MSETEQTTKLFDLGSLVNLRVGSWSGRRMLTETDLRSMGIDPLNLPADLVNLGRKLLVPKSSLQRITKIEARGRFVLSKYSVPFGAIQAYFVPIKLLPTVLAQLQTLRDDFELEVDSFIERFGEAREEIKIKHSEFYEKCLSSSYPLDPKTLRKKYYFKWTVFKIDGISSITSLSDTDAIQLKKEMENTTKEFVGEYVETMRSKTIDFCNLVAARVKGEPLEGEEKAKKVTPRSIAMFRKAIANFQNMNIFNDDKVESLLQDLGKKFLGSTKTPSDFESSDMKTSLLAALDSIKSEATKDSGSQFISAAKRKIVL